MTIKIIAWDAVFYINVNVSVLLSQIMHPSIFVASRQSINFLTSCHVVDLEVDQQTAMSLTSLQVQHANERPPLRHVRQPHSRHGKHRISGPAVVALDDDSHEHHLVLLKLPLQRLVPNWLCHRRVVALTQETADPMMLFVSGGLALWRLAVEIVGMNECTSDIWFHLIGSVVFWGGHVGGAADMEAEALLASSAQLSVAAGAESCGFQNIAIGAGE
jgi:hypothetical protein